MTERLTPLDHFRRIRAVGSIVLLGLIDRLDTRYADRLNDPDYEYKRITGYEVETPVATEAELEAGDV